MIEQAQRHLAEGFAAACGSSILSGLTIGQLNQYLQAGSFIVAMITGFFACRYYYKGGKR